MTFYQDAVANTFKSLACQRKTKQSPKKGTPCPPAASPPAASPSVGTSASSSRSPSRTPSATASMHSYDPDLDTDSEDGGCRCWFRSTKHRSNSKKKPAMAGPRPHAKCLCWRKSQPTAAKPKHKHDPKHTPKHHGGHHHHPQHHGDHCHYSHDCHHSYHCHHAHGKGHQCHAPQLACPIGNAVMSYLLEDGVALQEMNDTTNEPVELDSSQPGPSASSSRRI